MAVFVLYVLLFLFLNVILCSLNIETVMEIFKRIKTNKDGNVLQIQILFYLFVWSEDAISEDG